MDNAEISYEDAWGEDGDKGEPLVHAVTKSKVEQQAALASEYVKAHQDLDKADAIEAADPTDPDEDEDGESDDEKEERAADDAAADESKKGAKA